MLIVLLIFALMRTLRGVPLGSPSEFVPLDPCPALALRDTETHFGQRTVNELVISCFATILACTWSAVHPNIPAVTDSKWTCFKRRVTITICALLTPELMTYWAMRQRMAARQIMDRYNEVINSSKLESVQKTPLAKLQGWFLGILLTIWGLFQDSPLPLPLKEGQGPQWTLAHGFFLQMGGFMLCERGRPIHTLIDGSQRRTKDETILIWNIKQKVIDPPRITEEDIQDRSKGDALSKTFIVLQTTWFVIQCIARWAQRLPVTELEVVTLGFAMLNGITYGLWWDKPQNVARPVFLERKKPRGDTTQTSIEQSTTGIKMTSEDTKPEPSPLLQQAEPEKESFLRRKLRQEWEEHAYSPSLFWHLPYRIVQALLRPLDKMSGDGTVTPMRVGMFYTTRKSRVEAAYATFAIGALFGAVHLVPSWFLPFASRPEMWLWRGSAIIITAYPMCYLLVAACTEDPGVVSRNFLLVGFILYVIARMLLLTLSLTALRALPLGALQTVEWTTFIPHL